MQIEDQDYSILSTPQFLKRSLTPRGFALRVGVSPTTVHRWLEEGLPSGMIGARLLIHVDTADNWLRAKLGIKIDDESAVRGESGV